MLKYNIYDNQDNKNNLIEVLTLNHRLIKKNIRFTK